MSKTNQPHITEVINNVRSYQGGTGKAEKITEAIVYMIIKDCMPFRTVEKQGFLRLMKLVSPLYKVPSRSTISTIIDDKYSVLSTRFKNKFDTIDAVSLTCDVWTETTNTQSFLGLTAHYMYNQKLESSVIGVTELNESHTAEYLGNELKNTCVSWNIKNVVSIVSDNAANISSAIKTKFSTSKHLPCLAHTINLVITQSINATNDLSVLLENVKEIVTYFKRSVKAADELKKLTGDEFNTPTRLIQSVSTRWNSTFFMVQRFLVLQKEISTILISDISSSAPKVIIGRDIETLREIEKLREPFENITRDISGESYVTCSKIIPIVYNLYDDLNTIVCSSDTTKNLKKNLVHQLIDRRFSDIEFNSTLAGAMLVDPRFKKSYFKSANAASKAIQSLNDKIVTCKNTAECRPVKNYSEGKPLTGIWKHHQKRIQESLSRQEENEIGYSFELKQYLKESLIDVDQDPISYWQERKNIYPLLHKIAAEFFITPATSVPSERLFSAASVIMTKRRNRIKPEKLQKILFLKNLDENEW